MHTVRTGFALSLALHALAFAALPGFAPARDVLRDAAPLVVQLMAATSAIPPATTTKPLRPRPAATPVIPPLPAGEVPASPTEALAATPSIPAIGRRSAAASSPPSSAPVASVPPANAETAPVTPPLFDADYLRNPAPAYPALSRRLREQGRVVLRVRVNAAGAAAEVAVQDSSGSPRLDEAARDAVLHWTFVPARRGREPLAAWVLVPVSFRLESQAAL